MIVSDFGVFVFETKNYKGWIFGDEYGKYWTQVIFKRKERLYNPLRQNYVHVQALKEVLKEYPNVKYIPIVVFSINSKLKINTNSDVIYSINLLRTIKKYKDKNLTEWEKNQIFDELLNQNRKDKESKNQHVRNIKDGKRDSNNQINQQICPKCGGKLVRRKGKYGYFTGCSGYPDCRYTS